MWSVENPWDVVTGENILVFIMFELTLPAKTSISRPHAGFLVVLDVCFRYPRFRQGYFIRTESTLNLSLSRPPEKRKSVQGSVVCRFSTLVLGCSPHSPTLHLLYKQRERERALIVFPRLLPTCCVNTHRAKCVCVWVCGCVSYARYALFPPPPPTVVS